MLNAKLDNPSKVYKAAIKLFAQKGFHNTTTREIAKKAGVGEATIFRHFESKERILQIIIQGAWRVLNQACRRLISKPDAIETLMAVFDLVWGFFLKDHRLLGKVIIFETRKPTIEFDQYIESILLQGQQDGVIREDVNIMAARQALIGVVHELILEMMQRDMGATRRDHKQDGRYQKEEARHVFQCLLEGLEGPQKPARKATPGTVQSGHRRGVHVKPMPDRVLFRMMPKEKKEPTAGEIIIPKTGPDKINEPSNKILIGKYSGAEIKIDGAGYLIIREEDVISITDIAQPKEKGIAAKKKEKLGLSSITDIASLKKKKGVEPMK